MEITRRQFVKITALTTSGIVIGTPKTLLSSWNQKEKSVKNEDPKIRVVGIGGAGCCAVKHMIRTGLKQAEFIVADTDPGDLEFNSCRLKILIDVNPFKRGVCKGDPETVYLATLNSKEAIRRYLRGSDLVLIVAGLGGHTGTIGAPVVAQISKALGAWTVAVVTTPFPFERKWRSIVAEKGLRQLDQAADVTVLIPGENIVGVLSPSSTLKHAFRKPGWILSCVVQAFSNTRFHCVAFEDVKKVFSGVGRGYVGIGKDRGNGLIGAVHEAINSPLLRGVALKEARGIICNMSLSGKETIGEIREACKMFEKEVHEDADVLVNYEDIGKGKGKVTLIAMGFA